MKGIHGKTYDEIKKGITSDSKDGLTKCKRDFESFRLMDLKATPGNGATTINTVSDYVEKNLAEVLKYFQSDDEDFGLSPHMLVLLGGKAQPVFKQCIQPRLKGSSIQCIGFAHPTAMVKDEAVIQASTKICEHLRSVESEKLEKWVYKKDNWEVWEKF